MEISDCQLLFFSARTVPIQERERWPLYSSHSTHGDRPSAVLMKVVVHRYITRYLFYAQNKFLPKYLFHLKIFLLTQQALSKIIHISTQPAFISLFLFSRLHSLGVPVAKGCGNALFYLNKWTTYQRQGDRILTSLFYSCHSFLSKF